MFNNKIGSSVLHETKRFGMVYVDFTNRTKKLVQIFLLTLIFSWIFLIPHIQGYGRICWLLSEILFCPLKMNKKIRFIIEKTLEAT